MTSIGRVRANSTSAPPFWFFMANSLTYEDGNERPREAAREAVGRAGAGGIRRVAQEFQLHVVARRGNRLQTEQAGEVYPVAAAAAPRHHDEPPVAAVLFEVAVRPARGYRLELIEFE